MPDTTTQIPKEYITQLNMNGLRGRMLEIPARKPKNRKILVIYGQHTSLERMYGFADALKEYGTVTMPDLPGFGGMDSLYKIHEKPDFDTLADYLASFIKLRYRNKNITIAGFSIGFLIVTRMLQRYPELSNRVEMVISFAGFAHYEDFKFTERRRRLYLAGSRLFEHRLPAFLFRNILLNPTFLRLFYKKTHNAREKFDGLDKSQTKAMTDFEVHLWRYNDVRTYMKTTREMFTVDNTKQKVPHKLWYVTIPDDKYFDGKRAEKHLKMVFERIVTVTAKQKRHMPIILADKTSAQAYFPPKLRAALRRYKG